MKKLQQLIKQNNFDWINSDIISENFPIQPIRSSDYKLYHFDEYISSDAVEKEMAKDGCSPANIFELFSWKEWNGEDWVVGLGSSCSVRRDVFVPVLHGGHSRHGLVLLVRLDVWIARFRFLAVRTSSLESQNSALSPSDTLQQAIDLVKKEGYVVSKII